MEGLTPTSEVTRTLACLLGAAHRGRVSLSEHRKAFVSGMASSCQTAHIPSNLHLLPTARLKLSSSEFIKDTIQKLQRLGALVHR